MRAGAAGDSTALVLHWRGSGAIDGRRLAHVAAAWLRSHLTEILTVSDLCYALDVRERTLHAAFYAHMGTSPKAYFKELRLTAAHSELRRASPGTRVTDVALRWGFLHFGWFAHDYRHSFGETPSATLRRAVPPPSRRPETAERGRVSHYAA